MANLLRWKIAQFAERNWWKNYLKGKDVPTYLAWKKNYWKQLVQQLEIEIDAEATILDAGCGPAGVFMLFPENKVCAFDPLISSYEKDLAHFKKHMYANCNFVESGLETFKANEQFDFIFCMNAINHVQQIETAYDNLVTHLKPGGHLIISIDAHNHQFFRKLFAVLPGDVLHPHQYNLLEYEQFLTQRGLQMQKSILLKKEYFFNHYVQVAIK
jgi:2-polyprenyl-3-methyl-5-hydroxy-6-metoxy-1,4-benzoquinol methylase